MAAIDMTGKIFNRWKVIERAPNNKNGDAMWLCECLCKEHTRQIVKGSSLRSGHSKSCGCLKKEQAAITGRNNSKNLQGKKFGHLLVLEKAYSKNYKIYWKCKCDCLDQNIVYVPTDKLVNGHTQSCGCLVSQNLLGKTFGKLTVIEKTNGRTSDGTIIWKCQCSCLSQNIIEASSSQLINNQILHCGCEGKASKGENIIRQLLQDNNISFQREKTFPDCKLNLRGQLRFDFFVNNKYVIEYDGEQHFRSRENSFFTEEVVKELQERDNFKNNWCKENGIPIIRIPYTHLKNIKIEDLLLETSSFILD